MKKINLKDLKITAQNEIKKVSNLNDLDVVFKKYLGKKGKISQVFRSLKKSSSTEKAKIGKELNEFKSVFKKEINQRTTYFNKILKDKKKKERIDITRPGKKPSLGSLHPLTLVRRKTEEIFQNLGFSVVGGSEIENEWYNFDALNIPSDHPARDLWDTFWIDTKEQKLLLRTHTSPVQIHYMENNNPPLRIIVPGRCFRYEATDASHDIQFYQVEGLMVDKEVSVANFKAIIQEFFRQFFGKPVEIRLRPSYFPFTEPSFEVDMTCLNCGGKGCSACSQTGWMEMMGAGMVHPNVYKACGLNPKMWQGFAFGMGLDRLAMMKYKINDIRLFYGSDLRFLKQF